jgi:hypothetical protein
MFEMLNDAWLKARYSKHYRIWERELAWLTVCVEDLGRVVQEVCLERIQMLERSAAASKARRTRHFLLHPNTVLASFGTGPGPIGPCRTIARLIGWHTFRRSPEGGLQIGEAPRFYCPDAELRLTSSCACPGLSFDLVQARRPRAP